jgi:hypothetical protein
VLDDTKHKLGQGLEICISFNIKLYESTDVSDISQLLIFIQMFFSSDCIEEELLKTIPLPGKARGEDTFQSLYARLLENECPSS